MKLEDVKVVGGPLSLSADAEVTNAERELGAAFPDGYREYVTTLGEGTLGGTLVRVYPPRRILSGDNNVHQWRKERKEYWFWDDNPDISVSRIDDFIIIGDTLDGDEFCFDRHDNGRIVILPRNEDTVFTIEGGMFPAIEWLCSSGVLTEAFAERNFVPFETR